MGVTCICCDQYFTWNKDLLRHQRTVHGSLRYDCSTCGLVLSRRDNYRRHMTKQHTNTTLIPDMIGTQRQLEAHQEAMDIPMDIRGRPAQTPSSSNIGGTLADSTPAHPLGVEQDAQDHPCACDDGTKILTDREFTLRKKECALKGYVRTYCVASSTEEIDASVPGSFYAPAKDPNHQ